MRSAVVGGLALGLFALAGVARAESDLALGRTVFLERAEPACGICHTLADAGTTGEIGPNLDELRPTEERVRAAVKGGVGVMPAFEDLLTQEEIDAVSAYVASVTTD